MVNPLLVRSNNLVFGTLIWNETLTMNVQWTCEGRHYLFYNVTLALPEGLGGTCTFL